MQKRPDHLKSQMIRPFLWYVGMGSGWFVKIQFIEIDSLPGEFERALRLQDILGTAVGAGDGVTDSEIILDRDVFQAYFTLEVLDVLIYMFADFPHNFALDNRMVLIASFVRTYYW
jgi:hypothetical protein